MNPDSGLFHLLTILYDAAQPLTSVQIDNRFNELDLPQDYSADYGRVGIHHLRARKLVRKLTDTCCPHCGTKQYKRWVITPEGKEIIMFYRRQGKA